MIPCPSCGTRNRRGSKYCYRCGQRLDVAFDVSCPACDRLNPGGSAFCAFCGAKILASLPAKQPVVSVEPVIAEQPVPVAQEPVEGPAEGVELPARAQRELPPWLYEEATKQSEKAPAPPTPATRRPLDQSKYLGDIPGALPKTAGWLSPKPQPEIQPAADQTPPPKPKAQSGCLTLALLAVSGVLVLVLASR